jgi:hypothetical protein
VATRLLHVRLGLFAALATAVGFCASAKTAVVMTTVPYFEQPAEGLLPKGYLDKKDTCSTDSVFSDSGGVSWFHVRFKTAEGWVVSSALRYIADVSADFFAQRSELADEDMHRRADVVKAHPEWPLRIRKAIHSGQVCIDMNTEQIVASWGEPREKRGMYMLGVGDYYCLVYKGHTGTDVFVTVQNDQVIGWSVEKQ